MKVILSPPVKHPDPLCNFPKNHFWRDLFFAGVYERSGIYMKIAHDRKRTMELDFNYCYDFFDLTIFDDYPQSKDLYQRLEEWLTKEGFRFGKSNTWKWVEGDDKRVQIYGMRFCIDAEKE